MPIVYYLCLRKGSCTDCYVYKVHITYDARNLFFVFHFHCYLYLLYFLFINTCFVYFHFVCLYLSVKLEIVLPDRDKDKPQFMASVRGVYIIFKYFGTIPFFITSYLLGNRQRIPLTKSYKSNRP